VAAQRVRAPRHHQTHPVALRPSPCEHSCSLSPLWCSVHPWSVCPWCAPGVPLVPWLLKSKLIQSLSDSIPREHAGAKVAPPSLVPLCVGPLSFVSTQGCFPRPVRGTMPLSLAPVYPWCSVPGCSSSPSAPPLLRWWRILHQVLPAGRPPRQQPGGCHVSSQGVAATPFMLPSLSSPLPPLEALHMRRTFPLPNSQQFCQGHNMMPRPVVPRLTVFQLLLSDGRSGSSPWCTTGTPPGRP